MASAFDRRDFLKLIGMGTVAGTVGCSRPPEHRELVSQVFSSQAPPAASIWYATTCRECPAGCGLLVRTVEGRAVKIEGNPEHPVSSGGVCVRGHAALQGLYNPDRFRGPLRRVGSTFQDASWDDALEGVAARVRVLVAEGRGRRVAFLSGENGDSRHELIEAWMRALGSENYVVYEPISYAPIVKANELTFGVAAIPAYKFAESDYLISFGADFLETWLSPVSFTRAFAQMRRRGRGGKFVHIEPRLSLTAANADEWIAITPGHELWLALSMASHILQVGGGAGLPAGEAQQLRKMLEPFSPAAVEARLPALPRALTERLASEFAQAEAGLAIGGGAAVHDARATQTQMAINLLNYVAGAVGRTVRFDQPLRTPATAGGAAIRALAEKMKGGEIDILFLHHANPLFNLPPEIGFAEALEKVATVVSFACVPDETTSRAHWVLPDLHPLEKWDDQTLGAAGRALAQPVVSPVFEGRDTGTVLLQIGMRVGGEVANTSTARTFEEFLISRWRGASGRSKPEEADQFMREALRRGGAWADEPAAKPLPIKLSPRLQSIGFPELAAEAAPKTGQAFLHVYPSSRYYDGRGANKPWLHEIPDPITNVVWDSWAEIHPTTAARMGVAEGDLLRIESNAGAIELPAYLYAGVQPETVAVPLGLGHSHFGRYADARGANPVALLPAVEDAVSGSFISAGVRVQVSRTGRKSALVRTDGSMTDHGRGFAQVIPVSALAPEAGGGPGQDGRGAEHPSLPSLYPPHEHKQYRWGMAIDLNACTGCSACVAACYAENNVPVVGKERVAQGRHMAWIRIERYIEQVSSRPDVRFTPMLCQQCDNAPCEPVCPVNATMHSSDGLNLQVYNRCVGTRYCSNNCPYKVRTFNWFDYEFPAPLHLQLNPDVSERSKGIMEKCTFCIQRIRAAKDRAQDERRAVGDGEAMPACAQSCPSQAITFGNLLDPASAVSKMASRQHGYKILEELNTRPAITYLPRIRRA